MPFPITGVGPVIAVIVIILVILGMVGVLPFTAHVVFGLIGALAIARLV